MDESTKVVKMLITMQVEFRREGFYKARTVAQAMTSLELQNQSPYCLHNYLDRQSEEDIRALIRVVAILWDGRGGTRGAEQYISRLLRD